MRKVTAERVAAARELAAAGLSNKAAAASLGIYQSCLSRLAKKHGIKFRHDRLGFGVDRERVAQMAALYRSGKTLQQIGDTYGVTRERVRQIIRKNGVRVGDGGQAERAAQARARAKERRNASCLRKHGCTWAQYRELRRMGQKARAQGTYYRSPTGAFTSQRANARKRGIGWELTLWQWWAVWQESAHWGERGRGNGYMMCRYGDDGPYALGNVFIAPGIANSSDQKRKTSGLPCGVKRQRKRFAAIRMVGGQKIHLGSFPTPELAHAAYLAAAPSPNGSATS